MNEKNLKEINNIVNMYTNSLNLCAAENYMSDFAKIPLNSNLQEKYIMGGTIKCQKDNNFIGSESLFKIYEILNELCFELFNANYADARTLTGMNAITTLLMALTEQGDTIYLSNSDVGGHGSFPKICERLGLNILSLPYDYKKRDFKYDEINNTLIKKNVKVILIGLSDILYDIDIKKIKLNKKTILIYDVTQTLGLIAGRVLNNPLDVFDDTEKVIMVGATHKTLPGPSCGLILSKNLQFAKTFDSKINPDYLRNVQIHQILSLIYTLVEFKEFGSQYSEKIVENANYLGELLLNKKFKVVHNDRCFTQTHQLFILMDNKESEIFMRNATKYNILLNLRKKKIYESNGIRIGLQEVTRMGFDKEEMQIIAELFCLLLSEHTGINQEIKNNIKQLNLSKKIHYTFDKEIIETYSVF